MLCQKCHKNLAQVRYAEVIDGKVTDLHLCSECLKKYQQAAATGFELAGSAPTPTIRTAVRAAAVEQRTCPTCGIGLQEMLETGRVGCGVCYDAFKAELEPMLRERHYGVRHRGKAPRLDDARARLRADLQTKRALLRTALKMENYEEAAELRDAIRTMETGLGASESRGA